MPALNRIARSAEASGHLLLLGLFLVPAQSLLWVVDVPVVLKLAAVGVATLACLRPADGLIVVAALAPLGVIFSRLLDSSARGSEALVLAFLVGWLLSTCLPKAHRTSAGGTLLVPVLLFGAVVVTSCVEQLAFLQFQRDYPWPFVQAFFVFLTRDYLLGPGGFGFVQTALRLLEGLALFVCVVSLCRTDGTIVSRLARALVTGAVGAALLSFAVVAMDVIRTEVWTAGLADSLSARWSGHIVDVNAAGSYFLLTAAIALGAALAWTRWSAAWMLASLVCFSGLWLTSSRAALLSALILIGATAFWSAAAYFRFMTVRRRGLLALAATATVAILAFRYSSLVLSPEALDALNIRRLFVVTTLGMVASRPLFGVGIGGYSLWSAQFSPPELLQIYYRENAHNYFLQIAGELGLVGLTVFLWLLCTALWSAWPGGRVIRLGRLGVGPFAGVTAFLLTCLAGHPLVIPEVIYPFWVALGLAVAAANVHPGSVPRADSSTHAREAWAPGRQWMVASMAVVLLFSIPARVAQEAREVDMTRIAYGFHAWEEDPTGTRFRWTGRRARLHVAGEALFVDIPLRAPIENLEHPLDVDVFLDGLPSVRVRLVDNSWQQAHVEIPPDEEKLFRQIEVLVGRTFIPRDSVPDSTDSRELGVQVGEVSLSQP